MTPYQNYYLMHRMKIIYQPRHQLMMKRHTLQWYRGYAETVLSALQHSRFQRFLGWLLKHEHIPMQHVKAIHIRTFPRIKENGRSLNGTATGSGIINLYPIARPDNVTNMATAPERCSLRYVQWRARATLIHELLHYKYHHRERRVRQLTQHYTHRCMQPTTRLMRHVFNRIFRLSTN